MRQPLILHPGFICSAVRRIEVDVARPRPGTLVLHYFVSGDIDDLSLPPSAASGRADELWRHSCFEAFLGAQLGYFELNFAPSTQWAAYRFDGYRSGMRNAEIVPPLVETRLGASDLELRAEVALPEDAAGPLGLAAVIEEKNGRKSYWALAHPPGDPDFHRETCFALELPPAPAA